MTAERIEKNSHHMTYTHDRIADRFSIYKKIQTISNLLSIQPKKTRIPPKNFHFGILIVSSQKNTLNNNSCNKLCNIFAFDSLFRADKSYLNLIRSLFSYVEFYDAFWINSLLNVYKCVFI